MTAVTRDDIERLVESMDRTIALPEDDEDRVSWKTMSNAWVLVSKMFRTRSAPSSAISASAPPTPPAGVAPPEHGERKSKVYLYPSEVPAAGQLGNR